jgi:hypothetical protein
MRPIPEFLVVAPPTSKAHDTGFFPDGAYLETVAPPAATVLEITQPRKGSICLTEQRRLLAHRDQIFYKDLTSAFGAKRKWAARQSPLPRSKVTQT